MVARSTASLIGEGRRFRSARELAQRAHTLGYVENADSFARSVARVCKGDHDTQLSTIETIARTANVMLTDLLAGVAFPQEGAEPSDKGDEVQLSVRSVNEQQIRRIIESLPKMSRDALEVMEYLSCVEAAAETQVGAMRRKKILEDIRLLMLLFPIEASEPTKLVSGK
jgi:hypothetical protein